MRHRPGASLHRLLLVRVGPVAASGSVRSARAGRDAGTGRARACDCRGRHRGRDRPGQRPRSSRGRFRGIAGNGHPLLPCRTSDRDLPGHGGSGRESEPAELLLDGRPACTISARAPACTVDLGPDPVIHSLELVRRDKAGRVTESVRRWVNKPGVEAEVRATGRCEKKAGACDFTVTWAHPAKLDPGFVDRRARRPDRRSLRCLETQCPFSTRLDAPGRHGRRHVPRRTARHVHATPAGLVSGESGGLPAGHSDRRAAGSPRRGPRSLASGGRLARARGRAGGFRAGLRRRAGSVRVLNERRERGAQEVAPGHAAGRRRTDPGHRRQRLAHGLRSFSTRRVRRRLRRERETARNRGCGSSSSLR